jgi:hypothetical protein
MIILSVDRQSIKQSNRRGNREERPVLVFHCEFFNEWSGKTDNFYVFACVFYKNNSLFYGISQEPDCNNVIKWRTQLCYAMKDAMNDPLNQYLLKPMDTFVLSSKIINELTKSIHIILYSELNLEPGSFKIIVEPKDSKRVLKKFIKEVDEEKE